MTIRHPDRAAVIERLERDFRDRFFAVGATGFDAWTNATTIGVEARFGRIAGPIVAPTVTYARRTGWLGLFGPIRALRTLAEAEADLRRKIEDDLRRLGQGEKPRIVGGPKRR